MIVSYRAECDRDLDNLNLLKLDYGGSVIHGGKAINIVYENIVHRKR